MDDNHNTIERYERGWLTFGLVMVVVFILLVGYTLVNQGGTVPIGVSRIDATKVRTQGEFANPRVEQVGNEYVVHMQAFAFGYLPSEVRVKKGTKVTFYITSPDVVHGFNVQNTNINVEVIPGEVAQVSTVFNRAGQYQVLCNEYCGIGHANMISKIVVEE
ncbi:cytochrome C oxidase subunit II [Meiothermus granaticius]|uniref:cytochrome-c oxidase n=1 Tax=Meiothermus granaticius NBRC 107808 TaxID=1227551 RepID=A0A399F8M6_9DEIN|nr:cytochrome C oxidase subunit II [Meiothermus granaticius]MCL6525972.1 cytochrome C oxidase subunit II [Thermaceae bacterium]RIH92055.1 cytochrome c oxidase subunit 2 [Meiothermus granaticius NBRC 107808]GEM85394.1 cytochrome c oxidase subunit 2 [Meiothermus granaticius NBRC 107808]